MLFVKFKLINYAMGYRVHTLKFLAIQNINQHEIVLNKKTKIDTKNMTLINYYSVQSKTDTP